MDNTRPRWPSQAPGASLRVAVCRHDQADGGVHWDLFVERPGGDSLWSLRCRDRPDQAARTRVTPMADHRPAWLASGTREVSGERGTATRVADGVLWSEGEIAIVRWSDGRTQRWVLCEDHLTCDIVQDGSGDESD